MLTGNEFQAVGQACDNARSPNLVRSRGVIKVSLVDDCRPERDELLATVSTMLFRQVWHFAMCIECITAYNLY